MRRASRKRTVSSVHTTSSTPPGQSPHAHLPHDPAGRSAVGRNGGRAPREFGGPLTPPLDSPATEVLLSSEGTFVSEGNPQPNERSERRRQLAIAIRQRIESRLAGRVRQLVVRITGDTIVLEGECTTYYTKQLAQHAALGVLDDEHLENAIVVSVPR